MSQLEKVDFLLAFIGESDILYLLQLWRKLSNHQQISLRLRFELGRLENKHFGEEVVFNDPY